MHKSLLGINLPWFIFRRFFNKNLSRLYSQIRCSVPPNIATLPSILQSSCSNCSEQVESELASCNYISFNKFVDFNTFKRAS